MVNFPNSSNSFLDLSNDSDEIVDTLGQLPAGIYKVVCSKELEIKRAKDNVAIKYANLEFEIVEGQYMGRKIWNNFMLEHPTAEKVVEIARGQLVRLFKILLNQRTKLAHPGELIGKPVFIEIFYSLNKRTGIKDNMQVKNFTSVFEHDSTQNPGKIQGAF